MLSEHEESIIVQMMLLQDCMKTHNKSGVILEDMIKSEKELIGFIDERWDYLTEEEKNQVLDSYREKRNEGSSSLPPIG